MILAPVSIQLVEMDTDKTVDPVKKALKEIANMNQLGQSTAEVISRYDNWPTYDEDLGALKFKGPKVVADALVKYLSDNRDVRVLDVAAGTRLVGAELKAQAFNHIDALDASEGMLKAAKQKDVYRNYIQEFFPCEKPSVKTSGYDVLVVSHGFTEGHLMCDCLPEMVRCVKTGGLVVISVREDFLTTVAEYKDRLEPLMRQLEMEGQWQILERTVIPNIYHTYNGVLFVLKVIKPNN